MYVVSSWGVQDTLCRSTSHSCEGELQLHYTNLTTVLMPAFYFLPLRLALPTRFLQPPPAYQAFRCLRSPAFRSCTPALLLYPAS